MEKVRKADGLVCICAECKQVISTVGTIPEGGTPLVSHGICPSCANRLYGHLFRGSGREAEGRDAEGGESPPGR